MREILFRGKRIDNGEWVHGDLVHVENKSYISYYYESPLSTFINEQIECDDISIVGVAPFIEVDLTTIGQYTGLTDKTGKKIFEGDIVKYKSGSTVLFHKVVFERRNGCAYFGIVVGENETWDFNNSFPSTLFEIVGNIHDNPELLEVDK